MVTGTIVPGSFPKTATSYELVRASMENLLNAKYLDVIAKQYLGKSLFKTPTTDSTQAAVLHDQTAKTLVKLFYRAFGLPRGIEIMMEVALVYLIKLEDYHGTKNAISTSTRQLFLLEELEQELKDVSASLEARLEGLFPSATSSDLLNDKLKNCTSAEEQKRIEQAIELLDIKAALCWQIKIKEKISDIDLEPQILEEEGYLTQWTKIDENTKKYTRPFLYSYNDVFKPLALLQTTVTSKHWKPFDISLSTLILHPNCSVEDGNIKGKCFEHAAAASIYARYKLVSEGSTEVELRDIFNCTNLPAELQTAKVGVN